MVIYKIFSLLQQNFRVSQCSHRQTLQITFTSQKKVLFLHGEITLWMRQLFYWAGHVKCKHDDSTFLELVKRIGKDHLECHEPIFVVVTCAWQQIQVALKVQQTILNMLNMLLEMLSRHIKCWNHHLLIMSPSLHMLMKICTKQCISARLIWNTIEILDEWRTNLISGLTRIFILRSHLKLHLVRLFTLGHLLGIYQY